MPSEDRISVPNWWFSHVSRTRFHIPVALAGLFFAGAMPAIAADTVVTGDSLGVGIAMASGFQNKAANSVSIRGGHAVEQLRRVPRGSTVFMSLGTNDAVGSIKGLEKGIDQILQTARASDLKLVWIGPPCVLKSWDKNSAALDAMLRERLAGTGITYISMRDPQFCTPSVRAKDGVHFNMDGYRGLWSKAASATGYQVASVSHEAKEKPARTKNAANERKERDEPTRAAAHEPPRVRTVVTTASLTPLPLPAAAPPKKRLTPVRAQLFSFDFRWPESSRYSGSFAD